MIGRGWDYAGIRIACGGGYVVIVVWSVVRRGLGAPKSQYDNEGFGRGCGKSASPSYLYEEFVALSVNKVLLVFKLLAGPLQLVVYLLQVGESTLELF